MENNKLIESILDDLSISTGESESQLIETYLLKALLPKKRLFKNLVRDLYTKDKSFKDILFIVCNYIYNLDKVDIESRCFIDYMKKILKINNINKNINLQTKEKCNLLADILSHIVSILENKINNGNQVLHDTHLIEDIRELKSCINELKSDNEIVNLEKIYDYINQDWVIYKYYPKIYTMLQIFISLSDDVDDTIENRCEFLKVLREMDNSERKIVIIEDCN